VLFRYRYIVFIFLVIISFAKESYGQADPLRRIQGAGNRFGRTNPGSGKGDSLTRRTGHEDSITINFRYLDSSRFQKFDSSVTDFTNEFPIPWYAVHLGNTGTAARSLLFSPLRSAGWDHGFHSFDIYNLTLDETRFYNTTRPYSEIGYLLGGQAEQLIQLIHTQNILPSWNMGVEYRMLNSPGFFQNQNTNHNNYRVSSWYQSRNRRYQNFVVILGNKLQAAENGGIRQDGNYLDSVPFEERSTIPTRIGPNRPGNRNFFNTNIATGTKYTNATFLMRQQYDLGQKDSIVTDSSVIPLFYPRLRLEHTISYRTYHYRFEDNSPDSTYYADIYDLDMTARPQRLFFQDRWKVLENDFSIYQFPDAKNPQQFFKAGAALQNISGSFDTGTVNEKYYNFYVHGEYRNKTRNQKWDIEAHGNFFINGLNAGDYDAYVSLKRLISRKLGYLQVGFENINRTPSFNFDPLSSFYFEDAPIDLNKENIIHLFGSLEQPARKLKLSASYFMVNNLTYWREYYKPDQASTLFNVLRVTAEKQFRIGRRWNWRTWIVVQQKAGDAPVNLPLLLTRNQFAYDGNLGFKNLLISMGLEFRYFTPYKAEGYSPLTGQFYYQDSETIRMKVPEITPYVHFRIKTFTAYARAENLNTLDIGSGGFTNNNVLTIGYPYPGMHIRLGIFWSFVN
jgi:hypothetical protein